MKYGSLVSRFIDKMNNHDSLRHKPKKKFFITDSKILLSAFRYISICYLCIYDEASIIECTSK